MVHDTKFDRALGDKILASSILESRIKVPADLSTKSCGSDLAGFIQGFLSGYNALAHSLVPHLMAPFIECCGPFRALALTILARSKVSLCARHQ